MRQIKFRAWVKEETYEGRGDAKKMFYDVQNTYDNSPPQICGDSFGGLLNNDDIVIMQFTGLKDKNNKEIYEGDIIKPYSNKKDKLNNKRIGVVIFKDGAFLIDKDLDYAYHMTPNNEHFEVIGNIYENPELMEEK